MRAPVFFAALMSLAVCSSALAGEKYSFQENLHVGQKVTLVFTNDYKEKSVSITNGRATNTDSRMYQSWKLTMKVLEARAGSAVRSQVAVDPDSYDKIWEGPTSKKEPCPFAGKTITVNRLPDESFTNDFQGEADVDEQNMLNSFISPDQDYYPEKPVAVGDVWDVSAKVSKHADLGPKDQLMCTCRLDWVKTIDSRQMAQISYSQAVISHEDDNVEEDVQYNATQLVDIATGMIVKCEVQGKSKFISPPAEKIQKTGGTEFTFHCEVVPALTTRP